jgi:hypothetical protein
MSEGEFAAAPTPVEPKQIIKYKTNKVAIIGMLLFAAIAIGLGVWLAIVLMNPPKVTTSSSDESGQDNCEVAGGGDIENGGSGNDDSIDYGKKVRDIADQMATAAEGLLGDSREIVKTYDGSVAVNVNDDLSVPTTIAYGIYVKDAMLKVDGNKINSAFSSVLTKNGLKKTENEMYGVMHYKSNEGIYCTYDGASAPYHALCAYKSWIDEDNTKLAKMLQKAYGKPAFISVETKNVVKSSSGNYERVDASFEDSAAMFYKKSGTDDWKFFRSTQAGIGCKEYNTDELKEVYEGVTCWDETTKKDSVVKR